MEIIKKNSPILRGDNIMLIVPGDVYVLFDGTEGFFSNFLGFRFLLVCQSLHSFVDFPIFGVMVLPVVNVGVTGSIMRWCLLPHLAGFSL